LFRAGQFFLGGLSGRHTTGGFFPTARGKSSGRLNYLVEFFRAEGLDWVREFL
jgi:hypothetical protein